MHNDPQTLAREMVVELDHPRAGRVKTIGLPVKFSATPGGARAPAPLYGQHTRAVLAEYGYDAAEIDRLIAEGAIVAEEKLAAESVRPFAPDEFDALQRGEADGHEDRKRRVKGK